jgi:hypothetical protein
VPAKGFEAGHLSPGLIAMVDPKVKAAIAENGDTATHGVGGQDGGVPEAMIVNGLLEEIPLQTVTIDPSKVNEPLPLYWHPALEGELGMQEAHYDNATERMIGAAAFKLGDELVDRLGQTIDDLTRGVA